MFSVFANEAVARKVYPLWQQLRTGNIIREKNVVVNGDLASSSHHLEMHRGSCLNIDQIIYFLKDIRIRRYVYVEPMPFAKLIFVQ